MRPGKRPVRSAQIVQQSKPSAPFFQAFKLSARQGLSQGEFSACLHPWGRPGFTPEGLETGGGKQPADTTGTRELPEPEEKLGNLAASVPEVARRFPSILIQPSARRAIKL